MPKPTNPLWKEHTNVIEVVNTPGQAGTGCRKWSCKYCGFTMSSTITRVVMHLTGINCTNNCGKCEMVPPGVREALIAEKFPACATTDKGKVAQQTQDRLQDALLGQLCDSSTQVEESSRRDDILFFIESRWKFMSRPIHGMAALLHSFYKTPELFHGNDLLTLKNEYINDSFEEQEQLAIDAEMCKYMNNLGPSFSRQVALRLEATSCPLTWWQSYGRQGLPCLTTMALRLLSQDCSAGACERNWSAYSLIHNKIRNCLSTSQLEKLVYCRANMRLVCTYHALGTPKQVTDALRGAGLETSNLIVGIDVTKSNEWTGKQSFNRRSLHATSSSFPNPYEQAIQIVGETLSPFDDDNLIPCFGFGDVTTHDQSVFSFHPNGQVCNGFEEVLSRYREIIPNVRLSGPTSFAPIIRVAMDIVEETGGQYHVLLIIADGQVTRSVDTAQGKLSPQEQETITAIVEASDYALSIVLVGVGDGPWDAMKQFDDSIPRRVFDNFQFVNFTSLMAKNLPKAQREAAFALAALMEIPLQYKATLELGILNRKLGTRPRSKVLPPPGSTAETMRPTSFSAGSNSSGDFSSRDVIANLSTAPDSLGHGIRMWASDMQRMCSKSCSMSTLQAGNYFKAAVISVVSSGPCE
ncbi:hypothetical protein L7F22_050789 [Adiantum nelumboides]|nr:hypothetical protein [Adiantum nelumboides]